MIDPLRLVMWFRSLKLVLLFDMGELQVVGGCDLDDLVVGDIELCCATVYGIKLLIDSVDLNDSLRNCFT